MSPNPVRPKDLRKFVFISDPQTSPDGSKIAYVHTSIDHKKNDYVKKIWMHDLVTGTDTQFTYSQGKDSFPRWSPNGEKLLFLSSERQPDKKAQLYIISTSGGEAKLISDLDTSIATPQWSPNGKTILFCSRIWEPEKPETDVMIIKRIRFKLNGVGLFPGKRVHLFTINLIGGKPKQITKGEYDVEAYCWSPNSKEIAYVTNMEPDQDISYVRDIYVIPAKGGEAEKITNGKHQINELSWSKYGICYFGHDFHAQGATNIELWMKKKKHEKPVNLTKSFDRSIGRRIGSDLRFRTPSPGPVWGPRGKMIYILSGEVPYSSIYGVDIKSRKIDKITNGVTIDGFSYSEDFKILAYNAMTSTEPCELYVGDKKVTGFNSKHLKNLKLSTPRNYLWENELGVQVDGWVMKPIDYKEGEKYPTILQIHGGPLGIYGEGMYQEFQILTSAGYTVIFTNPRGSGGYGEDYASSLNGRYGTVDYKDVMDFTKDAIKRFNFIDENRIGVTGGSYGGYLTNWIITQTDLFKAAVSCRSTCNRYSHHGHSDLGFRHGTSGNMGYPWRDEEKLLAQSPLRYAKNVNTPTLFIHSENDLRCIIQQAEEYFVALMELGVETELVRFPDENHELSRSGKPKHREERFKHIVRWFDKYLK
jgi:dipeptidyl aminopeptidase/acylaminoacyl peptidase